MCGRDQLWLNDIVSQYEVRYIKAADALMRELAKQQDYASVMQYAARAHELFPGNGLICYWLSEPMREQILTLKKQVILLKEARDRLLPKLMSGEIEV